MTPAANRDSGDPTAPVAGDPAPTMRAVYDRIAPDYAAANAQPRPGVVKQYTPSYLEAVRRVASAAGTTRPRVVEVGCGPGRDMAWLEGSGIEAVGVDLSRGMLNEARTRARGWLLQADMRRLPLAAGRFHGAWCNAALLHLPRADAPDVLAQIAQLVLPGAPFFLTVQGGSGETWEHQAYGHTVDRFFARYSADEVVVMLAGAGFAVQLHDEQPIGTRLWLRFLSTRC